MTADAGHPHDWLSRLMAIDRRFIFLGVALAVALPMFQPIGLPIIATQESVDFYEALTEVKPGEAIIFAFDYEADVRAELDPMALAVHRYCFENDIKIIALTNYPGGPGVALAMYEPLLEEYGKTYGTDYAFLGYNADYQGTMLRFGESIRATFPTDQFGRRTGELPIMQGVDKYADIPLLVSIAGSAMAEYWAIFGGGQYQQKVVTGCTAIQAILIYPYYNTGQISGFLGGIKGAAELENLCGHVDAATKAMDSQSAAHALMVVFIVLGNVAYLVERRRDRKVG